MKRRAPLALDLARRIAAGEPVELHAGLPLDPRLMRGLGRVADIARRRCTDGVGAESWGHLRNLVLAGSGSYGEVFRAYDSTLDRDVALKLKRADVADLFGSGRDFVAEAQRLARVRHPHVIAVHGASFHQGRAGLWADWIDGETLRGRLDREPTLASAAIWRLAHQLASALVAVHAAGLTHGDVKPANVMLARNGDAVLMDFGASFYSDDAGASMVTGTPRYLAPEIARGERPSAAVDIYALGILLFRAVAGHYPVPGEAFRAIGDRALSSLLRQMLADDPMQRPTATATLALIERVLSAPLRRARWLAVTAMVLGLAGIAIVATMAYRRADALRVEAQQALAGTERANQFLTELLAHSAPDELGPAATLRDLLDVAPVLAEQRFASDARGRGLMLSTLARIEAGLANDEVAAGLAQRAAAAATEAEPDAARTLLSQAHALVRQAVAGDADAALVAFEALMQRAATRPDAAALRPRLLADLAEIEHRVWLRHTRPELRQRELAHLTEALAAVDALDAETELQAWRRLGSLRLEQGGYPQGVALLRHALKRAIETQGIDHATTALTRRMLAWYLLHEKRTWPEAEALFRENLQRHARKLGPRGRTLIDDQFGLAHSLLLLERIREALPLAERAWAAAPQDYGPAHRTTLDVGLTYAAVLEGAGRLAEAQAVLSALRGTIASDWSVDSRHYIMATQQLANVQSRQGHANASALYADCAARAERLLGADNPLAISCRSGR